MNRVLLFATVLIVSGCAGVTSMDRPDSYYQYQSQERHTPGFQAEGNLVDEDIDRLIAHRLELPPLNRIAVLKLSTDSYWRFYSNDFSVLSDKIVTNFIGTLRSSPRVYDASFLPAMLIPEQRSVNFLREAAARFQADLLLTYRSSCQNFEKYRFIKADETQAYCTVEALLLDVRTGIVPFTSVTSQQFQAAANDSDMNFQETVKKAELEALAKALHEVADNIVKYLENLS